ncbi:archaellin/type IV pilin N-terminal domain-containing protein [Natrinema sp. 1APR25-10V2]|uniref:archaellin/type IV pilin N-terminal domain-containing protein n=1 Tax=Natrinema sp. 1APR25-10V2 TaxID=2951081 RepID=UPI002876817C|nr:archaellin/type IV pilin N-terminal domain-containing protein [Natrinema sp. 1APR25-10V2]MDS0476482.1 flagellin [Natrinema sp. 1APR25-10V2]
MFEAITDYDTDDRGQVGIGTLIVFIAMVLVAAIAADVLINTAGVLQSQASDTGSETQEEVANQIDVIHAVGNVSSADRVDRLNLTIKKSAGSNAIDLNSTTIQYTSDDNAVTLVHGGNNVSSFAGGSEFVTNGVDGYNDNSLTDTEQRVVVTIDTATIEGGNGLQGGADATLKLVDQSGAQYTYGVKVPSTFGDKSVVEV